MDVNHQTIENLTAHGAADDGLIWDLWLSRFKFPCVTVSDEIGVFAPLEERPYKVEELSDLLNVGFYGLNEILKVLAALNVLTRDGETVSLTTMARLYLLPSSPFYWGETLSKLSNQPEHKQLKASLDSESSHGRFTDKSYSEMWKAGEVDVEAAQHFTHRMHNFIMAPALYAIDTGFYDDTQNLLDVAGGSGAFCIAHLTRQPAAKASVFELDAVCPIATEYVDKAGLGDRFTAVKGNFFQNDFPEGYDGISFSNVIHNWPDSVVSMLMDKAFAALPAGGRIYIHEMLVDEQENGSVVATLAGLLQYILHSGMHRTYAHTEDLLKQSGFVKVESVDSKSSFQVMRAYKPE